MAKVAYNEFRHIVSAMLHIELAHNKEDVVKELSIGYAGQMFEPDPIVWLRKRKYPAGIYVRETFSVKTYSEIQWTNI